MNINKLPWKAPDHYFTSKEKHIDLDSVIWDEKKGFITIKDLIDTIELLSTELDKIKTTK
jgi:hypothetical protein